MRGRGGLRGYALLRLVAAGVFLLATAGSLSAQVRCSGNAGSLNERRYTVSALQIATGPTGITVQSFDAGGVVITQQVQVIIELNQQSHFVSLCLHADYLSAGTARAVGVSDLEWRRVSPDPMSTWVPVSRNTPAPVIVQEAVGNLTAVYEFRMRLRWDAYPPSSYSTSLFWSAYRNQTL
jgi:hypothetical protein